MLFGDESFMVLADHPNTDYDQIYLAVDRVIRPYVLRRISANLHTQEELLQDIHLTVWRNLPAFSEQAQQYTPQQRLRWLYTIASNKLKDRYRSLSENEQSTLPLVL